MTVLRPAATAAGSDIFGKRMDRVRLIKRKGLLHAGNKPSISFSSYPLLSQEHRADKTLMSVPIGRNS
jgi:hypothetical protein